MFGIRKQRAELREEIQDVLALIETNYNEEQQKMRNLEKQERLEAEARRRKIEIQNEQYKARYERFVAIVSSFTIPLVLISGIWGMNLDGALNCTLKILANGQYHAHRLLQIYHNTHSGH
jgi:Mg2+ and Co2+ transporter CorA